MARKKKHTRASPRKPFDPRGASPPTSAGEEVGTGFFGTFSNLDALAVLGLALMVVVCYFPALSAGFVWDDRNVAEQPVLHKASGLLNVWLSPGDIKYEGHYWPLVYTSFWLEHKLWGLAPLGYHLVNVLLHVVNCVLVWRLLQRLAVPGAWVIAAVFAVHPLHVESVAWVIERKDLLSALFYLTAVLTWIRFVETPGWRRYGLALALFTAGLLSKSVVVTLPAALLIWHWWQQGRITATDLLRLVPFFLVGLGITMADLAFYASREPLTLGYSWIERVLIAAHALWFYVGKLLWPTELAVIYPLWDIRVGEPLAWAYVVAALAVAALLWFGRHRMGRGALAGALFFTVTLSPVLGFVDYGYMQFSFVADRFQYLAGLGVLTILIGGGVHGAHKLPGWGKLAGGALAVVIVVLLGTLTWRQAGIYRDEMTFFSHVVSLNPNARDAHLNLGYALFKADRPEEALTPAMLAVEKRPDSATAHSNLGLVLLHFKRFDEAEEHLRRALALDPRDNSARQNMAELLRKQGHYEKAIEWFRAMLKLDPKDALAHAGLGDAMFHLDRHEEAVTALEQSLALQPDSPVAGKLRLLLGQALRKLGRLEAAAELYERALEIDPWDSRSLVELANLRVAQGRSEEADEYLRRVRDLHPRDTATLQNVAEALRKQERYEEAIEAYRAVLDIDPEEALAHAGLGDALFHLERYEEAIESLTRSLSLEPESPSMATRYVLMGQAAQALNRPEAAVEHFERALALDPHNPGSVDYLARRRFGQKRYKESLDLFQKLIEMNPDNAHAHSNLGATLYYLNRPEEAIRSFERALALDPNLKTARTGLEKARKILRQRGPLGRDRNVETAG